LKKKVAIIDTRNNEKRGDIELESFDLKISNFRMRDKMGKLITNDDDFFEPGKT
jgi:hypothetical protein